MKYLLIMLFIFGTLIVDVPKSPTFPENPFGIKEAQARVRYIKGYSRSNGTYVRGHYRDTSNDGRAYNNANNNGWN